MKGYNVLYICDYGASYSGNFIASLSGLASRVREQNTVFFLFPSAVKDASWLQLLPVSPDCIYFCDFNTKSLFQTCRHLSKELNSRPTLVHTHFVGDLFLLAIKASFRNVICHFHMTSFETTTFLKKLKRIVRLFIYHNVLIIGVSNAVTQDLKAFFPRNICESVPNAIDYQNLSSLNKALPANIAFNNQRFNILMHGTHFLRKGADIALQAVEELNADKDMFHLYITTNNVIEANALAKTYTSHMEYVDIINVVQNIKSLYDRIDLFISPSRLEAFGYAVAEAAFSDCQVAVSRTPGQDTMMDIPGIIWFDAEDVSSLKSAIIEAADNKEAGTVPELKAAQKAYAAKQYGIHRWIGQILELYNTYYL